MKLLYGCLVLSSILFSNLTTLAQNEDPAKIFSMKDQEGLSKYMKKNSWKEIKAEKDSIDGKYTLYKKKSVGGGVAYAAIFPFQFLHYQIFFSDKRQYSKVLSYDDFLHLPQGKSRYNYSQENNHYAIKSVEFDDPEDTRNTNIFYGKMKIKEGQKVQEYDPELHGENMEWEAEIEQEQIDYQLMMEDYNERLKKQQEEENQKKEEKK